MNYYSGYGSLGNGPSREIAREKNVHRMEFGEKSIILIGTAHVSEKSADQVARIIEAERPDAVCVELCAQRYETLMRDGLHKRVSLLDLMKSSRGLSMLWLMLWYSQKKLGDKLGIRPGSEIIRAIEAARATGAQIHPVDRDIRLTLERAWSLIGFTTKMIFAAQLLFSMGSMNKIRQDDVERMKQENMVEKAVEELGKSLPVLSRVLIEERDRFMAGKIAAVPGRRIVAVVGAAHVPGILREWESSEISEPWGADSLEAA